MKIRFIDTRHQIESEWASDAIPRIGEYVNLGVDGFGTVREVNWHFAGDDGKPSADRSVTVLFGDPLPTGNSQ